MRNTTKIDLIITLIMILQAIGAIMLIHLFKVNTVIAVEIDIILFIGTIIIRNSLIEIYENNCTTKCNDVNNITDTVSNV